ncbi:uncharacterized protein LOC111897575 [Lactuca sativa]|uniref:uncharacterized protein LOC111897575 n=1 Tax=Lactuca sativa TaxID=4236 RepID=UPI000CD9D216|nr:uncharacterized protein LOC111897575 [Lactuca sativa]
MSTIIEVTTHTHFPIKLTATNFSVWRKQVMATLIGLGLDNYVNGLGEVPYASISRSRIISLKSRLASNPNGTRLVAEFLHEMKNIAGELALAQSPVNEEDLVVHILSQVGEDYVHIAAALKVHDTTITFPDLFDKLVDH